MKSYHINVFYSQEDERNATKRGREMASLLRSKFGYQQERELFTFEDPQGEHTEESWSRRLPLVLEAFYGKGGK